jgi:hypothetical protein
MLTVMYEQPDPCFMSIAAELAYHPRHRRMLGNRKLYAYTERWLGQRGLLLAGM